MYEGKVKSSQPSLHETRDKWPLGRDPDRSWCHFHTNVKLSWLQPMDPWTERQHTLVCCNSHLYADAHTCMLLSMLLELWAADKKALH
jgi:hypothetical protein